MTLSATLDRWIQEVKALCLPKSIHLCNGTQEEYDTLCQLLVRNGTFQPLKRPGCFLCRSTPEDVARQEERTFICSRTSNEAGPTNHWKDPEEMYKLLTSRFTGSMRGRTMYVIPYCLGPTPSAHARFGVEITDSPYVAVNMHLMTRVGSMPKNKEPCVRGLHSVGAPLNEGEQDVPWPSNPTEKYIAHFPEARSIWSYGSGYGGNALLSKKCFALRIASCLAHEEGWLAEHMLICGVTNPKGEKRYFAAAFPSACGKTNLSMLKPTLPGWKVETVGDDIAWIYFGHDGRLWAMNPENGFFGVAVGTSFQSNPYAMQTITHHTIFTNVALTDDQDIWWEGMTSHPPKHLINWKNNNWTPYSMENAAHPNARFTVRASQCPVIDPHWEDPLGVPLSAIIFGGRRSSLLPLALEAFNWQHGVFLGASLTSETTAAAVGAVGKVRHDPFAMFPFCGYHMGDYFAHWLNIGKKGDPTKLPLIYSVNWFRRDENNHFLWPGFGDNSRILKWIFERTQGLGKAKETALGNLPTLDAIDTTGLTLPSNALSQLLDIEKAPWNEEVNALQSYFETFGEKMPKVLFEELYALKQRLAL